MIMISQRLKRAFWAAMTFTVIAAIPEQPLIVLVVFTSSFIVWWLAFKTNDRQIWRSVWVGIVIAMLSVFGLMLSVGFTDIFSDMLIVFFFSMAISSISILVSRIIHVFQTEPTVTTTTLSRQVLKTVILMVGVGILFFKVEMYLHSMDGSVIVTSISPSEKITFQIRKSYSLIYPTSIATVRLNEELRKGYSETCVLTANASEPTVSSKFRWNSDETIVSWKSPDNSIGEIDLRMDCGFPVVPASLNNGDPRKFVFVSPSRSKILFRKRTCLVGSCKEISALRVLRSDDTAWDNYHCNLEIQNGTQAHGGSIRTEDIPNNEVIAPIIRWDKNETVIYSAFQDPSFSFDLKEACSWE